MVRILALLPSSLIFIFYFFILFFPHAPLPHTPDRRSEALKKRIA
jgi:hypothetical protein